MKKTIVIIAIAAFVVTVSVAAYAHYEGYNNRGWGMHSPRGAMMYGGRGGMYAPVQMRGRGPGSRWNASPEATCPCGRDGNWNAPAQSETANQMITEDKAKEAAQEYLNKYLSGYTIDTIEKDSWRPLFFVTIKGENDAVQTMVVHGFSGQVINVFPQTAAE